MKIRLALALLVISSSLSAHEFLVLPEEMYGKAVNQCSRTRLNITGSWKIGIKELEAVEKDIHQLDSFSKSGQVKYSSYFRQYVGVIIKNKRYVYINAAKRKRLRWLLPYPIEVCGGGAGFFGVLYDFEAREFSEFQRNF